MASVEWFAAALRSSDPTSGTGRKYASGTRSRRYPRRSYFSAALAFLTLALAAAPGARAETVAGVTAGALSVESSGAARYRVPIDVPPGVAGMEPDLSLVYGSGGGNGLLGVGWSLGGLSVIHRCAQTLAQDNVNGGVNLDAGDRFCLDGQRLIAISGAYGADGTEYRSEIDGFARITSFGSAGTGPESFTVETKSRRILEYGVTADSRVEQEGGATVRFWALNRVFDPMGNIMDLVYDENTLDQTFKIQRIDYASNSVAATTPQSKVEFVYEARPDHRSGYLAGSVLNTTERLQRIETWTDGAKVREYRLAYHDDTVTSLSRLASLTECDAGTQCLAPITFGWEVEPAGFTENTGYSLPVHYDDKNAIFADVNGDGLIDYLYGNGATQATWINTGSGWQQDTAFRPPKSFWVYNSESYATGLKRGTLVDVNGDGLPDFVQAFSNAASARTTWLNTGSGWAVDAGYKPPFQTNYDAQQWYDTSTGGEEPTKVTNYYYLNRDLGNFVDLNGDGLVDFATAYSVGGTSVLQTWRNTGSGWVEDPALAPPGLVYVHNDYIASLGQLHEGTTEVLKQTLPSTQEIGRFLDVDSDGRTDLVQAYGNTKKTWLNKPGGWELSTAYQPPFAIGYGEARNYSHMVCQNHHSGDIRCTTTGHSYTVGRNLEGSRFVDLNGDGLADRLQATYINGSVTRTAWINTGTSWVEDAAYQPPSYAYYQNNSTYPAGERWAEVADVNADGLPDFVQAINQGYSNTAYLRTWLNTGTGWLESAAHAMPSHFAYYWKTGGNYYGYEWMGVLADANGDGLVDYLGARQSGSIHMANAGSTSRIATITDSLGRNTTIAYAPLTDSTVYTKGSGAVFPELDLQVPLQVVKEVSTDDGVGGQARETYSYEGLRLHLQGRGALGFARMTAVDQQTGIETVTDYRQDFPFIGAVAASETRLADGTKVRTRANTWSETLLNGGLTRFPHVSTATAEGFEINDGPGNTPITTATTTTLYDDFGNPDLITATTSGGGDTFETVTDNDYSNDTAAWLIGLLTRAEVTNSLPDLSAQTRVAAFAYDPVTGLLTQEVIEPDLPVFRLATDYGYDAFGNLVSEALNGADIATRTTTTGFSADGRFAEILTNDLGHTETRAFDVRFGTVTSLTGPNGITTTWDYDGFGRKIREARADGTETLWTYELCTTQCPAGAVYAVSQQDYNSASLTPIGPRAVEYFDALDRPFRTETEGFDGTRIFTDTTFNERSEVVAVTRPYFDGTAAADIHRATSTYDVLSRALNITQPDGGAESIAYGGLTTTRTNALGQSETRRVNALGQLAEVTDNLGTALTYRYDPFGSLEETDAGGVTTTMDYDVRGLKTSMSDPDMGIWFYDYNVLGELTVQTNPKGESVTLAYDTLGRLTNRSEPEGATEWFYDTAAKGIGKLHSVSAPHIAYLKTESYDSLGRRSATTISIDGVSYTSGLTYDASGRPGTVTYPSGFAIRHSYNSRGYITSVSEEGGATVYWQPNSVDAEGQITEQTFGNGVVTTKSFDPRTGRIDGISTVFGTTSIQDLAYDFDTLGNLKMRGDLRQGREETFLYDGLNRLTSTTLIDTNPGGGTLTTTSYTYDALGNLASKSDVGTYSYGGNGAGPHAVTAAGGKLYSYDANGNMTAGAGRTIAYASFNKPTLIREDVTGDEAGFVYGPDRARIKQHVVDGSLTHDVVYFGNLYERRIRFGSPDELVHYIRAGETVAIHTIYDDGLEATNKARYLHRDHLDSIDTITGETGAVVERLSYDAHGKRRLDDWTAGDPVSPNAETPRGFTGHEHLDSVGLIHMNGRVYDPTLGRFLSADPIVPELLSTQSFNRYSYVRNNPLSFTDPSGFHDGPEQAEALAEKHDKERSGNDSDPGFFGSVGRWFKEQADRLVEALDSAVAPALGMKTMRERIEDALEALGKAEAHLQEIKAKIEGKTVAAAHEIMGQFVKDNPKLAEDLANAFESAAEVGLAIAHFYETYEEEIQITVTVAAVLFDVVTIPSGEAIPISLAARASIKASVRSIMDIALDLKVAARYIRNLIKCAGSSFEGETLVQTKEGLVPIKDIRPNQHRVLARDEETGEMSFKPVMAQHWNTYNERVYIAVRDLATGATQTIISNRSHPFYVAEEASELKLLARGGGSLQTIGTNDTGRWLRAENLIAGNRLLNAGEEWSEVVSVRIEREALLAYNLTVAEFHTFFVKAHAANDNYAIWVHNSNCKRDALGRFTSSAGGNTPSAVQGKIAHKNYKNTLGEDYRFEVTLPSGKRVDAISFKNRTVRELKPDRPRPIKDGQRQLERNRQEAEQEFGGGWKSELDTYKP